MVSEAANAYSPSYSLEEGFMAKKTKVPPEISEYIALDT